MAPGTLSTRAPIGAEHTAATPAGLDDRGITDGACCHDPSVFVRGRFRYPRFDAAGTRMRQQLRRSAPTGPAGSPPTPAAGLFALRPSQGCGCGPFGRCLLLVAGVAYGLEVAVLVAAAGGHRHDVVDGGGLDGAAVQREPAGRVAGQDAPADGGPACRLPVARCTLAPLAAGVLRARDGAGASGGRAHPWRSSRHPFTHPARTPRPRSSAGPGPGMPAAPRRDRRSWTGSGATRLGPGPRPGHRWVRRVSS